jgi:F0F1-type ATP synthase assembly protein I
MLLLSTGLIIGLLIGFVTGCFVAGWRAATALKVGHGEADPFDVPHGWEREP